MNLKLYAKSKVFVLVSLQVILIDVINQLLILAGIIQVQILIPYEMLLLVIAQGLLLASRMAGSQITKVFSRWKLVYRFTKIAAKLIIKATQ